MERIGDEFMAQDIFQIKTMGDALRNTGYKSIQSAMSEIIDNSVQANAKNIFVIVKETLNYRTGKKNVSEIAFLDNGEGMNDVELGGCLGIGVSTRVDRKGMGRFGVGLPQASLYACPRVEVFSWQNGIGNCKKVVLDIDLVKQGVQKEIEDPKYSAIPADYAKYVNYKINDKVYKDGEIRNVVKEFDFSLNGTLVIWKKCDRVSPKTVPYLFRKLDFTLGQKFRYFIREEKSSITLISNNDSERSKEIMPNDPLMLMRPNLVLGNPKNPGEINPRFNIGCTEPVFEPYTNDKYPKGIVNYPIKYRDANTGEPKDGVVQLKFSKVRDIFYDKSAIPTNPGTTKLGKHVSELEGISVVRANREIDFGKFDFYDNVNEPQHRWWGCEIRFEPELDELFGVANNKQHVELKRVDENDFADEEVKPVWLQLHDIVHDTITAMYNANRETRKNARTANDVTSPTTKIINNVEVENNVEGEAESIKKGSSIEDLMKKNKQELILQGVENPTNEEVLNFMNNFVNIEYKNLGKFGPFIDYSFELGTCILKFNMDHNFYKNFIENSDSSDDKNMAYELLMASLVKAIDETKKNQEEQNDNLMQTWNEKLRKYVNELSNFAKN